MIVKFYKTILFFVTLLYPLGIVLKWQNLGTILAILMLFWAVNIFVTQDRDSKILSFFISLFFLLGLIFKDSNFTYFYPVMVNAFFLFTFLWSLKSTPIITRFALLHEPNLSDFGKKYTRYLTIFWCGFFLLNGFTAFVLIFFEDKSYWAYYNGFLSYILIGLIFMVEFLLRSKLKKRYDG